MNVDVKYENYDAKESFKINEWTDEWKTLHF